MTVHLNEAYRIVDLANGSRSIHSVAHGETFHPVIGPAEEAEALYVRQLDLIRRLSQQRESFVIWDVGLGAAANVVGILRATQSLAVEMQIVSFDHTIEPLRFGLQNAATLGYLAGYEAKLAQLATPPEHRVSWTDGQQRLDWSLIVDDFPSLLDRARMAHVPKPHAILFDAYSPATNPAMWTQQVFARLFCLLDPQRPCALSTYSRSTMLRVTLLRAGFFVGRGGSTGEKNETTIAANSLSLIRDPLDRRWLERVRKSNSAEPLEQPLYRQAPISPIAWAQIQQHPQFRENPSADKAARLLPINPRPTN